MEGGSEVQVPPHFLCPISLELMIDPVTLPTGITYDRHTIEHWLSHHHHCPVTNQPLSPDSHLTLTPNHTLRRLIHSWSSGANPSRPPPDNIPAIIHAPPHLLPAALTTLRKTIDSGGDPTKRRVESTPGALAFLASLISDPTPNTADQSVRILHSLQLSDRALRTLLRQNPHFLSSLTAFMRRTPTTESRAHAVLLLQSTVAVLPPAAMLRLPATLFEDTVNVLKARVSYQAMKAALHLLHNVSTWGHNAAKAVAAGAAAAILELLLDEPEKRACEMLLAVLDALCGCADGRAAVVGHAAGLAVLAKKMVRVSAAATESAVRTLYAISTRAGKTEGVVEEMLEAGVAARLCLLLQLECGEAAREMAGEMLRMHFLNWRVSPCFTPHLEILSTQRKYQTKIKM